MVIGSVAETEIEEAISVYDTNVFGAMRLSRAAAEIMQKQGAGTIVSMSSLGGILAVPHMSTYTSSKFALEAFSEALYHELRPHGVDVVIMQPVAMRMDRPATGSHLELVAGVSPGSPSEAMLRKMEADTLASPLTPEQVAAKIHEVLLRPSKPLRVPMDRAKALTWVKALAPQRLIDKLIAGLLPELSRTRESSYVGGRSSD
jgi:short-subunit dehydrogenase